MLLTIELLLDMDGATPSRGAASSSFRISLKSEEIRSRVPQDWQDAFLPAKAGCKTRLFEQCGHDDFALMIGVLAVTTYWPFTTPDGGLVGEAVVRV